MADREKLVKLRERVAELEESDRELDADIEAALFGGEVCWSTANYTMEPMVYVRRPSANHLGGFVNSAVPAFTGSIDAAVALIERALPRVPYVTPGWTWTISWDGFAEIDRLDEAGEGLDEPFCNLHETENCAISLILSLLDALLAQGNDAP